MTKRVYIFNCSTNVVGGGVQNAANFVKLALLDEQVDWFFVLSKEVFTNLRNVSESEKKKCYVSGRSPSKSLRSRREILKYVNEIDPYLIYTMAGPSYIKFEQMHVCGISNPYITKFSLANIFTNRTLWHGCLLLGTVLYQLWHTRSIDHFIFQTEASRSDLCGMVNLSHRPSTVVGNAIGPNLIEAGLQTLGLANTKFDIPAWPSEKTVIVPSSYYPHKNFEIIYDLVQKYVCSDYIFILTVSDKDFRYLARRYGVQPNIFNIGTFSIDDTVAVYSLGEIVLLPSKLEVFSTSYLEALYFDKWTLVADFSFSREICREYATYFDAKSSFDLFSKLETAQERLSSRDYVLSNFGSYDNRYKELLKVLDRC